MNPVPSDIAEHPDEDEDEEEHEDEPTPSEISSNRGASTPSLIPTPSQLDRIHGQDPILSGISDRANSTPSPFPSTAPSDSSSEDVAYHHERGDRPRYQERGRYADEEEESGCCYTFM